MSEWDFLWDLSGSEREMAMETGLTDYDLDYLEEKEEQERAYHKRYERNKAWKELKKLRDSGSISAEDFKKRKSEIFGVNTTTKKK